MGNSGSDMFQPQSEGGQALPPHLSAFVQVQEAIDAAVVGVRQIAGHAFTAPHDELTLSGEKLAASLTHLKEALERFAARGQVSRPSAESGFDESKLLASIEKWQRRYQGLESEYARVEARLLELEEENERLTAECQRMQEVRDEMLRRIERSIAAVDHALEEGDDDEEYRNYH